VDRSAAHCRAAAEALTREGLSARYLRSIFIPEDETCFFLLEAGSADAVREVTRRAGLESGRIAEALDTRTGDGACLCTGC
jgi:Nickel responsive protein SCO4226-like